MHDETQARLELALEISEKAGLAAQVFFRHGQFEVERKSDDSPVTRADRRAEELMRESIARAFPDDGVVGEEFGEQRGSTAYRWILDPIDGTKSFISGVPLYSVLVGILRDERSVAGVIRIPGLAECVYASQGRGAWWRSGAAEPRPARVSSRPLSSGLFVVSQVDSFAQRGAAGAFERLQRAAYITRTWGDGYGYLLVATGRAEVMLDPVMNLWDAAAVQPVLEEAGGAFTDWQGNATVLSGEGVGCNRQVLDEVLAITRDYPRPE